MSETTCSAANPISINIKGNQSVKIPGRTKNDARALRAYIVKTARVYILRAHCARMYSVMCAPVLLYGCTLNTVSWLVCTFPLITELQVRTTVQDIENP